MKELSKEAEEKNKQTGEFEASDNINPKKMRQLTNKCLQNFRLVVKQGGMELISFFDFNRPFL